MLVGGGRITSLCKLVRLSVGVIARVVQLVVVKSEFCCNTKFMEGMIQERVSLLVVGEMFNFDKGMVCKL